MAPHRLARACQLLGRLQGMLDPERGPAVRAETSEPHFQAFRTRARSWAQASSLRAARRILRADVASRLGLDPSVAVAVGNVDSFVSVPGAGVDSPGVFLMVIGTSICDLVIDRHESRMAGITGVVEDGILPGFFGYEAGQAAVGDMFAWFGGRLLGLKGPESASGGSWHDEFEREAAMLTPGASGLVALDWWNGTGRSSVTEPVRGNRRPHAGDDAGRDLPGHCSNRSRRDTKDRQELVENDVAIEEIVACGGIAERSALMMQLLGT